MSRVKGLVIFGGGLVLIVLGIGMWRSPEINWEGFLEAWRLVINLVINDIARLVHDPFAVLGIVVLIAGLFIAANGLRRIVVREPRKKASK